MWPRKSRSKTFIFLLAPFGSVDKEKSFRRFPVDDLSIGGIEFNFLLSFGSSVAVVISLLDEVELHLFVSSIDIRVDSSTGLVDFGGAGAGRFISLLAGEKTETGIGRR